MRSWRGFRTPDPCAEEVCDEVTAHERESAFVEIGRSLHPSVRFERVESLGRLPAGRDAFDFVLVFTVLQHCPDSLADEIVSEIHRTTGNPAFVLLCEETDVTFAGDFSSPEHCTVGRSVEHYEKLMAPFKFVETSSRMIEPGYDRSNVGSYMLFRRE